VNEDELPRCYNCNKDISEGFERCPHCGVPIRYTNIDDIKKATSLHTEGNIMAARGDYAKAIALFREAVGLFPDYAVAYYNLGLAHIGAKEYSPAIEAMTQAIRLKSDFAAAYTSRGDSHVSLGDLDEAVKDYSKAIELYPDYAQAYRKRAEAYLKKDEKEMAREDLENFLSYKPHDTIARRKLEALKGSR
jgi:tetratricopeptide (TPR) repeat protein